MPNFDMHSDDWDFCTFDMEQIIFEDLKQKWEQQQARLEQAHRPHRLAVNCLLVKMGIRWKEEA